MEPFTPDDPLWKLMGRARPVVPRPDFAQNVARAVRQESQNLGMSWRFRLGQWMSLWQRPVIGGAFAMALLLVASLTLLNRGNRALHPQVATVSSAAMVSDAEMASIADEDVSVPLDSLAHMDALVAMEDTSKLTDSELQFLLY